MTEAYRVEQDRSGCSHCGAGATWTVVGSDGAAPRRPERRRPCGGRRSAAVGSTATLTPGCAHRIYSDDALTTQRPGPQWREAKCVLPFLQM